MVFVFLYFRELDRMQILGPQKLRQDLAIWVFLSFPDAL